jgi:hypothetical protein
MPRGFKRNERATREALATGFLQDKRSFISQPKAIKGECAEPRPHLLLEGVDKGPIRAEIFRRNREANKGTNRCVKCGQAVAEDLHTCITGPRRKGDWHHVRNKPGTRCDCPENGEVICGDPAGCHSREHPQPQFGKSKIVQNIS